MGVDPYYWKYPISTPVNHRVPADYETDVRKISPADVANKLATMLFNHRQRRGLDQRDAADLLGISPCRLCEYENAKRIPSLTTLIAFANLYECTVEDLLGRNLVKVKEKKR